MRENSTQKELLQQYLDANEANKQKLQQELEAYSAAIKALEGCKKNKNYKKYKNSLALNPEVKESADACTNSRARILWYLNVIETNCKNRTSILDLTLPEKAKRERIEAGKYRAQVMQSLAKLEAEEKRVASRMPILTRMNKAAEKENGYVGKK